MPETCGCQAPPRRHCDVCYAEARVFLACSRACLERHQLTHDASASAAERARMLLTRMNARQVESAEATTLHRARVMQLLERTGGGGRLLVLGAGNASELDLPRLSELFGQLHLVDLDGASLERAKARQPSSVRARLVLHPHVDLSGLLGHLDDWGEAFPEAQVLDATAVSAARRLVKELRSFDVTLSTCLLSQLGLPFRRCWVAPSGTWATLTAALSSIHLATLAGCTGRRGILVFDVQQQDGVATPDPQKLLAQFRAPALAPLVASATLSEPWTRKVGDALQTLHAIEFEHPR